MRKFLIVSLIFLANSAHADDTVSGSAAVYFGGNSWNGVPVPGGLMSGINTVFTNMNQENNWFPSWVDVWNVEGSPASTGISNGQVVSWKKDFPGPNMIIHVTYKGNVNIKYWGWYRSVWIDYTATVSFSPVVLYVY